MLEHPPVTAEVPGSTPTSVVEIDTQIRRNVFEKISNTRKASRSSCLALRLVSRLGSSLVSAYLPSRLVSRLKIEVDGNRRIDGIEVVDGIELVDGMKSTSRQNRFLSMNPKEPNEPVDSKSNRRQPRRISRSTKVRRSPTNAVSTKQWCTLLMVSARSTRTFGSWDTNERSYVGYFNSKY